MNHLARALLDAFKGGLLSAVLLRAVFAIGASPVPDAASGRTEPAGLLPILLQHGVYMTSQQIDLVDLMSQTALTVGVIWAMTALLARAQARADG